MGQPATFNLVMNFQMLHFGFKCSVQCFAWKAIRTEVWSQVGQDIKAVNEVAFNSPVNLTTKSTDLQINMLYACLRTLCDL